MAIALLLFVLSVAAHRFNAKLHKRIAPDTYDLGERQHPQDPNRRVQGFAFLHTHQHHAPKQPSAAKQVYFQRATDANSSAIDRHGRRKRAASSASECSAPIAPGAVWKTSRGYYINARNTQQLTVRYLTAVFADASDAWNCVLKGNDRMVIGPLLSVREQLSGQNIDMTEPDGYNVVGFGAITDKPGTVAVTTVWGIFTGPVAFREIAEFDMLYDTLHYSFGNASQRTDVIDLGATATHEWGHALGLDDNYVCSEVTMYGSSSENETKKRTLEAADVNGLASMYPELN